MDTAFVTELMKQGAMTAIAFYLVWNLVTALKEIKIEFKESLNRNTESIDRLATKITELILSNDQHKPAKP